MKYKKLAAVIVVRWAQQPAHPTKKLCGMITQRS